MASRTYTTNEIAALIGRSIPHTQRLLKNQGIQPLKQVGRTNIWPALALLALKRKVGGNE